MRIPMYAVVKGIREIPEDTPETPGPDPILFADIPGRGRPITPKLLAQVRTLAGPPKCDGLQEEINGVRIIWCNRGWVCRDAGERTVTASASAILAHLIYGAPMAWKAAPDYLVGEDMDDDIKRILRGG